MNRLCPLCSATKSDVIKQIEYKDINYLIGKCQQCNFVYVINPNFDTVSKDKSSDIPQTPSPKKRHFQIEQLINSYYKKQETIDVLEVGSGYGTLAKTLAKKSRYNYIGFEPNTTRYRVCQQQNLNVKNCFFSADAIDFFVDVVVIDNVLEHVLEPKTLIENAAKVLNKNGMLIVIVPNYRDARQFIPAWKKRHFWQPSCHINYFTNYHLKALYRENKLSFSPFGLSSLNLKKDWAFIPKVLMDLINIYPLGLYCYGIKK